MQTEWDHCQKLVKPKAHVITANKISAVKQKGKSSNFQQQQQPVPSTSNQCADNQLQQQGKNKQHSGRSSGANKKKGLKGKGKAHAHAADAVSIDEESSDHMVFASLAIREKMSSHSLSLFLSSIPPADWWGPSQIFHA